MKKYVIYDIEFKRYYTDEKFPSYWSKNILSALDFNFYEDAQNFIENKKLPMGLYQILEFYVKV